MKRPLVIIVLAYILGILLGNCFPYIPVFYLLGILALGLLFTLIFFLKRKDILTNGFLLICFILSGLFLYVCNISLPEVDFGKDEVTVIGTIVKEPEVRGDNVQLVIGDLELINLKGKKISGLTYVIIYNACGFYHYGDKIKIKGRVEEPPALRNPGGFDYRNYLARKKIYRLIRISNEKNIEKLGIGKVNPLINFALRIKKKMVKVIRGSLENPQSLVLEGIMLGERGNLPLEIKEMFTNTGVAHILAVSGLHVMLIVFIFFAFFRSIHFPRKLTGSLTIVFIILYALIVGGRPSVIRATIMAIVGLVAILLERDKDFYTSLSLAAFIILLVNPFALFEVSFQLSFMVVLSIIYLAPYLKNVFLKFLPKWLAYSFSVSLSAWLGSLPIIAYYFHKVSLIAVIANLIVVPLVGIGIALGLVSCLVSLLSIQFAQIFSAANWLVLTGLLKVVKFFALLPFAFVYVSPPAPIFIVFYYGGMVSLVEFFKK